MGELYLREKKKGDGHVFLGFGCINIPLIMVCSVYISIFGVRELLQSICKVQWEMATLLLCAEWTLERGRKSCERRRPGEEQWRPLEGAVEKADTTSQ